MGASKYNIEKRGRASSGFQVIIDIFTLLMLHTFLFV